MTDLFVVVSAIGNDYGVFSYQERLDQLVGTIQSIKARATGSDVWLYDASEDPLPQDDVAMLSGLADNFTQLDQDKYINFLKHKSLDPSPNKFEKKTVGEIQAMNWFLTDLQCSGKQYKRVFKLSGRYMLSDSFQLSDYTDKQGLVVLRPKEDWYGEHVFTLRLWSFCFSQLDDIIMLFRTMQDHTYTTVTDTKYLELVEFTFTKFLEKYNISYTTVNKIGVTGKMGLGGHLVDE